MIAPCVESDNLSEERRPTSDQILATGPLAFWFLNHQLEESELLRQMEELKKKGFSGFFLHSRGGLRTPYGSEQWNRIIRYCVAEAKRLGLEPWLYDEDPYPSGAAGGRVIFERPEFRAVELVSVSSVIECGGCLKLPPGVLVAAYVLDEHGVNFRVDRAAGLIREKWRQHFSSIDYYPPYAEDGGPHWRAETQAPHYQIPFDGLPEGAQVVAFVRVPVVQNPWGEYTDMLNAEAVELFISYTHDAYAELLGEECGRTVPGIFTDEAKLKGRMPWSAEVPRWFREVSGVDLFEVLPHLVLEIDERTAYYRWAYRKALARGLREAMMGPMMEACQRHRLLLTGHISPEEDPMGQVIYAPGLMGLIGQMDLPGTDLIGSLRGGRDYPLLHLSPKLASSAAHGHGKRLITCESFAVCDWAQEMGSMTQAVHWLYALGVNRLVTHGQFYSIDGLRKREAPPSQFIQSAYWEHFGAFSQMVELLSTQLSQGVHEAPVLLYYPEESFMATSRGDVGRQPEAEAMRADLGALVHELLTRGYDFDLADEELLLAVSAEAGRAQLREERFEVIVVPGRYLSAAAWAQLQALELAGVRVLYVEESITLLEPLPRVWKTSGGVRKLWEALQQEVAPLWRADGELLAHLRRTEEGAVLFLCNNGTKDFSGVVEVAFAGPYEVCHPQEGIWRSCDQLELRLAPGLGVLIRESFSESNEIRVPSSAVIPARWGEWSSRALAENCAVLSEFRLLPLEREGDLPSVQHFSMGKSLDLLSPMVLEKAFAEVPGDRAFLTGFDWQGGDAPLKLVCDTDLGEGAMEFYLNGERLPEPSRQRVYDPMNRVIDLRPYVRQGRNHLILVQRCGKLEAAALPYDALRLFGDFHLELPFGRPVPPRLTPRPERYEAGFPLGALQMGHPHYGGLLAYDASVELTHIPEGRRIMLEVGRVFESMEVRVNGEAVGTIWCAPWRVSVPSECLRAGENHVELICACSPATYLQGLERPSGFVGPLRWFAESP